jgi:hypothetical protein
VISLVWWKASIDVDHGGIFGVRAIDRLSLSLGASEVIVKPSFSESDTFMVAVAQ